MITRVAPHEAARLAAVDAVAWPQICADDTLDDVVALAAETFSAPIAVVSLTERDQQTALASRGIGRVSAPRDISFCTHAVAGGATMIVEDAALDPRFESNPFVVNAPNVRFYAGALLYSDDGHCLGTLCILDTSPRRGFCSRQQLQLERMARLAAQRLQARALHKRCVAADEARVEAESYTQSVLKEAIGAFVACDRVSLNLEGRVRASLSRLQRELHRGGAKAAAEVATLRDMIDELATAVRLDRAGAKSTALFEPGALTRAIAGDLAIAAAERGVTLAVEDESAGAEMLGDSWRFEELVEGALSECIAAAQGLLRVACRFETQAGGHAHFAVRISAETRGAPWRLSARSRELVDGMAGRWELSSEALALLLPARLRSPPSKSIVRAQWGANVLSFDPSRKGSR